MRRWARVLPVFAHVTIVSFRFATSAGLDGDWISLTQPTSITQADPITKTLCACESDPLLKDPSCVLCYCPESGDLNAISSLDLERIPQAPENRTCGADGQEDSTLTTPVTDGEATVDAESFGCRCGPDPWLSQFDASWTMCKCPQVLACVESSSDPDSCTFSGEASTTPSSNRKIPDSTTYTHLRNEDPSNYPIGAWAWCGGRFALCSMANCTTEYEGKQTSDIGSQLAECGCLAYSNLAAPIGGVISSLVDPDYILSQPLYQEFQNTCVINSTSSGCPDVDEAGVCKAIATNTIYRADYDLVSTYMLSPSLGGFSRRCQAPGAYAQCMTAACYEREAFDGSPVTCYCPVYEADEYIVGGPSGTVPPCVQDGPYLLSGSATTGMGSATPSSTGTARWPISVPVVLLGLVLIC